MRSRRKRVGRVLVGWSLSVAVGWPGPVLATDAALPDPFLRQPSPLHSIAVGAILTAILVGALWWIRHRSEPRDHARRDMDGPRVIAPQGSKDRRRPPRFHGDLRSRETMLENLEDRSPNRPPGKVIELPGTERRFGDERDGESPR